MWIRSLRYLETWIQSCVPLCSRHSGTSETFPNLIKVEIKDQKCTIGFLMFSIGLQKKISGMKWAKNLHPGLQDVVLPTK